MGKLYVEGGGDHNEALRGECRRAFSRLFDSAGLSGRRPRVVACGSRSEAFRRFRGEATGSSAGEHLLLVDSEEPVRSTSPWEHALGRAGDGWKRPAGVGDEQLHFMVQVMESWFLADRAALAEYFGSHFDEAPLPKRNRIEDIPKSDVERALQLASRDTAKKEYRKGRDSFELLGRLDPKKVREQCPWAARFFDALDRP